jgi:cobalamin biosynthesis Mg chelatase CobN
MSIIEATYGPGFQWRFKSAPEADAAMTRITAANRGELGAGLAESQRALNCAMTEMVELRRLGALKRRKWDEEARLRRSIAQWLRMCDASQRLHETEIAMREAGYDLGPVEADARALVQERYRRHVEATAASRQRFVR